LKILKNEQQIKLKTWQNVTSTRVLDFVTAELRFQILVDWIAG